MVRNQAKDQWPVNRLATFNTNEFGDRFGSSFVASVSGDKSLLTMIDNQGIAFVKSGEEVSSNLAAYPFQRHGMLDGVVKTVMADSQTQDSNQATSNQSEDAETESGVASTMTFKATIELKRQSLMVNESPLPLAAGMQLSAEIVEGKRTVLQYLLSPVQRVVSEAGMER